MIDGKGKDYVEFDSLQKMLGLNDMTLFLSYLKEVYKDLSERSEDKKKGINKITFFDYIKIPIFIAEKLFSALDKDEDNFLNSHEFIEGLQDLYMGDFESTLELIFKILDFDKDGKITKEDTKVLLSYLPLKTDNTQIEYKFQMQSLNEIDEILEKTFGKKHHIKQDEFEKIIESRQSDVYLQILCFLYQKKPFNSQNVRPLKDSKKKVTFSPKAKKKSSPNLSSGFSGEHTKKKMVTPSKKSTLSPAEAFLAAAEIKEEFLNPISKTSFIDNNTPFLSGMKGMIRMNNQIVPNSNNNISNNFDDVVKNSQFVLNSPSRFLKGRNQNKSELDDFDMASNLIQMENLNLDIDSDSSSDEEGDNKKKKKEVQEKKKKKEEELKQNTEKETTSYENWVYKISSSNKLIKYFLVVIGKDIYYYKSEKKK